MLCAKFGWNWSGGTWEEDFSFLSMYFWYFIIISPWERAGAFIWTNLNPIYPRMLCAKFGWNWSSGSGEEDFFYFINAFKLFHNYLHLEKGGALHSNKVGSPSPKDILCQVWLKLAQWLWIRRFLKFDNVYLFYLPLENGVALHLNKRGCLHPKMHCAMFGWNWSSGSGEEFFFKVCQCISATS